LFYHVDIFPQIEKFIETIFPTQKAEDAQRRVKGELSRDELEKRKAEAENKSDVYFLLAIMGVIIFLVAGVMVSSSNLVLIPSAPRLIKS
jgi:farnesyl-diphosphate farnesyltransferase